MCGYQGSSGGNNSQTQAFGTSLSGHQRLEELIPVPCGTGKEAAVFTSPLPCGRHRAGDARAWPRTALLVSQRTQGLPPCEASSPCRRVQSLSLLRCQLWGGITVSSGHLLWRPLYLLDSGIRSVF